MPKEAKKVKQKNITALAKNAPYLDSGRISAKTRAKKQPYPCRKPRLFRPAEHAVQLNGP